MALQLTTAGESHGPALVAVLEGLPAGLLVDKAAIDTDLRRRQEGYGRSPRQQIEQDEVEVLAGLRHGRTLGTPLALVVRNRDHANYPPEARDRVVLSGRCLRRIWVRWDRSANVEDLSWYVDLPGDGGHRLVEAAS